QGLFALTEHGQRLTEREQVAHDRPGLRHAEERRTAQRRALSEVTAVGKCDHLAAGDHVADGATTGRRVQPAVEKDRCSPPDEDQQHPDVGGGIAELAGSAQDHHHDDHDEEENERGHRDEEVVDGAGQHAEPERGERWVRYVLGAWHRAVVYRWPRLIPLGRGHGCVSFVRRDVSAWSTRRLHKDYAARPPRRRGGPAAAPPPWWKNYMPL